MAYEKPGWKDVLQTAKSERSRSDDRIDQAAKKKLATLHYNRRKLDKDVKTYTNKSRRINSRDIDKLGRKHGFYITGTLPGKD